MPSLEFLSQADDLLALLFLDINIFGEDPVGGRRAGKMNSRKQPRIKQKDLDVVAAVVHEVRTGVPETKESLAKLSNLDCVKSFMAKWREEEGQFVAHARKYLGALRPDSGIAFHETDRRVAPPTYAKLPKSATVRQTPSPTPPPAARDKAQSSIEVAVFATRSFKKGDKIKLKGGVANLTEDEDDALRASGGKQDFSVLHSARKGCFSLLLGPARFVNHDCRNNVEFVLTGNNMEFKVVEDIEADEQLFTHYGDHYFDTDNASCLCSTCEQLERGAFAIATKPINVSPASTAAPGRKRGASPSRRSSRTGLGLGHELTAQRSLSRSHSRSSSSSLSSLASSRSSSPTGSGSESRGGEDKRRSERTVVLIDDLRKGKRLVHPRLKPPPGYAADYQWNKRQKTAVYIGLTARPAGARPPKRKREDSPTSDFQGGRDGHPSSASKLRGGHLDPFGDNASKRRRRVSSKPKKPVVLGARTSSRNPTAIFDRLDAVVGLGDSDSELTDLEGDSDSNSDSNSDRQDSESDLSELTPSESEDGPGPSHDTLDFDTKANEDEDPDLVPATPEERAADERVSQRAGEPVGASLVDAGDASDLTVLPSSDGEDEVDRRPATTAAQTAKLEDEPASVNEAALAIHQATAELDDLDRDADDEAEEEDEKPVSVAFEPGRSPSLEFDIAPRRLASTVMPVGLTAAPLVFATSTPVALESAFAVPDASVSAARMLASAVESGPVTELPAPGTLTTSQPPNPVDDFDFDPDEGDLVDDIVLVGDPRAVPRASASHSPPHAERSSELVDAPAEDRAGSGDTSNMPTDASTTGQAGERREAGGQANDGAGDAAPPLPTASAGGQGGDDDDGKDHRKVPDPVSEVEPEVEPESEPPVEVVEPAQTTGPKPAAEDAPAIEATVAPSESDEDCDLDGGENEEAALLLLMLNPGPSPATSKAPPADSSTATRLYDIPLAYGPAPDSHAPSPPKTSSASETSTGSSRSLEQGLVLIPQKRRRAARAVPDAPDVKTEVLRSTRRNSLLSPSPPAPAPLSRSTSTQAVKKVKTETGPTASGSERASSTPAATAPDRKRGRTSGLSGNARSKSTARPSPSASPRPTTSRESSREGRSTRRSQPIPGDLKDLMNSPLVTGVSGGYDAQKKRYYTTAAGKRTAQSPSPEPEAVGASPEPEARGTRRSRPIDGDIQHLLASPRVAAVAGGFDPISRKYVSKKRAERDFRSGEAPSGESGSEAA